MRPTGDRASTLLFFPAALLVMVVLAAVTVDFARLHLAQRQVDDLAAATANDAVTVGLDVAALRSGDDYRLAPNRVRALAAARAADAALPVALVARLTDARSVTVTASAPVPLAFSRAIPGAPQTVTVQGEARATAHLR
jgi:hypothetical protein